MELLKPGETRFGSNFTMAERCINVHDALEELVASKAWKKWVKRQKKCSKKDKAAEVNAIINNKEIWKDAKVLVKLSKPFVVTMEMADGDVPSMGKIYKRMFDAIEDLKALKDAELSKPRREAMVKQAEER